MEKKTEIPYTIYAENTPNPQSMKFVANKLLIDSEPVEFLDGSAADTSPLAQRLFQFPFVTGIFIAGNYITVNKIDAIEWHEVVMELRVMITEFLNEGGNVLNLDVTAEGAESDTGNTEIEPTDLNEFDLQIAAILDEYVRPAVEQDGGAINFHSFNNGVVTVNLRGACSGCPSSSLTLKSGIETILKRMIPEVTEVVAVEL